MFGLIIFGFIINFLLLGVTRTTNVATENRINLSNIPAPTQTGTKGSTTKAIKDGIAEITYVAEYVINGRVVDVESYNGSSVGDKLSPRDVGLAWGILSTDESQDKIKWTSYGNRFLNWKVTDTEWLESIGGSNAIYTNHSNNHLIPSSDEVERNIKSIRKGDYVQIEGYLVDINWKNSSGSKFWWNTSTTRTDTGNGACEVIYVKNITWLR